MSSKVPRFTNEVGNAVGEQEVCDMWKKHFDNLHNSVLNGGEKDYFISRAGSIHTLNKSVDSRMLQEVIESIQNQMCTTRAPGKSSGPNGLYLESFIYGGLKLYIHLSLLFTSFVRHCYLPRSLMEIVIKPMVKNKGGDLTDVNNYRAIALSNVETKIFEAIVLCKVLVDSEYDAPQFGFKTGHSTGLCLFHKFYKSI